MKTRTSNRTLWIAGLMAGAMALTAAPGASGGWVREARAEAKGAGKAAAKDDKASLAEAKKHYGDGEAKFKEQAFGEALSEFEAADKIKATPQAARYIGLCLDNLGRLPEAVTAYERFLGNVPAKMAAEGDKIKQRVEQIKQLPGKLHVDSDPKGATVAVDGKPQATATPLDVDIPPGHHKLHFTAADHEAVDREVDVTFASKQDVTATLPASAPAPAPPVAVVAPPPAPALDEAPPPPPAEPAAHSKLPAYITGGLAVAALGVGTVFGVMALSDKSDFDKNPTTSKADDGESHALIADMAFGVAVTLGVTSAVLFLSHDDAPAAPSSAKADGARTAAARPSRVTITPTPVVTMHGAGAGALVRF